MREEEKIDKYLHELSLQCTKISNAYGKALSYCSKLKKMDLTEPDKKELMNQRKRLSSIAKRMERHTKGEWSDTIDTK